MTSATPNVYTPKNTIESYHLRGVDFRQLKTPITPENYQVYGKHVVQKMLDDAESRGSADTTSYERAEFIKEILDEWQDPNIIHGDDFTETVKLRFEARKQNFTPEIRKNLVSIFAGKFNYLDMFNIIYDVGLTEKLASKFGLDKRRRSIIRALSQNSIDTYEDIQNEVDKSLDVAEIFSGLKNLVKKSKNSKGEESLNIDRCINLVADITKSVNESFAQLINIDSENELESSKTKFTRALSELDTRVVEFMAMIKDNNISNNFSKGYNEITSFPAYVNKYQGYYTKINTFIISLRNYKTFKAGYNRGIVNINILSESEQHDLLDKINDIREALNGTIETIGLVKNEVLTKIESDLSKEADNIFGTIVKSIMDHPVLMYQRKQKLDKDGDEDDEDYQEAHEHLKDQCRALQRSISVDLYGLLNFDGKKHLIAQLIDLVNDGTFDNIIKDSGVSDPAKHQINIDKGRSRLIEVICKESNILFDSENLKESNGKISKKEKSTNKLKQILFGETWRGRFLRVWILQGILWVSPASVVGEAMKRVEMIGTGAVTQTVNIVTFGKLQPAPHIVYETVDEVMPGAGFASFGTGETAHLPKNPIQPTESQPTQRINVDTASPKTISPDQQKTAKLSLYERNIESAITSRDKAEASKQLGFYKVNVPPGDKNYQRSIDSYQTKIDNIK